MRGPEAEALDPEAADLLATLDGPGSIRLADQSPAEARRRMAVIPLHGPRTEPLERVEDRSVPGPDGGDLRVRLYAATDREPLPVLIYLHGGGWVTGTLDTNDFRCRRLAGRSGCLLVSVDYRLAPEYRFPAAVEDAYAALRWAMTQAASVGGDPERVAIAGDSSGGNLAAAVTLMARDRGEPGPVFQLLTCPVTDREFESPSMLLYADGYMLGRDDSRWCWDHYLPDAGAANSPYACPLRAGSLEGLPPALVITAELDPLRDQGEAYAARLREAGVPAVLSRYRGMIHAFVDFEVTLRAAGRALEESSRALRAAWSGGPPRMVSPEPRG